MNRIEIGSKNKILSDTWNIPDTTAIIISIALGAIALIVGVLGFLSHQGIVVRPFNTISTFFPKAYCGLIGGVGGALILSSLGVIIFKSIKSRQFKERFKGYVPDDAMDESLKKLILKEKKFSVVLDNSTTIPKYFKLYTENRTFIFKSVEAFIKKVRKLEKCGYQNIEKIEEVQIADPVSLSKESMQGHPHMYWLGVTVSLISLPAFIIPFFCPFPYAWTLQTAALGVLTAVSYGIVNDQLAIRQSKKYFTLGHTPFHKRLLQTDNSKANGIIWGIHATWILGAIAGVVLALVATVTHTCAINPLYLTPITMIGSLAVNLYAHIKSKNFENACKHPIIKRRVDHYFNKAEINPRSQDYDRVYLRNVPEDERPGWLGVGRRNGIGYTAMPALSGILLVAIIAARVLLAVV